MSESKVHQATDADFAVLKKEGNLVVDFYADWCGPCKTMSKIVEALETKRQTEEALAQAGGEQKKSKLPRFVKVDTDSDDTTKITARYAISSLPTFIAFKNGKEVDRYIGAGGKRDFENWLKETFG